MIAPPTRVYAYETAESIAELENSAARRMAEGWERVKEPQVTQVKVRDGAVHMVYRQEYLKFLPLVSRAGFVSCT